MGGFAVRRLLLSRVRPVFSCLRCAASDSPLGSPIPRTSIPRLHLRLSHSLATESHRCDVARLPSTSWFPAMRWCVRPMTGGSGVARASSASPGSALVNSPDIPAAVPEILQFWFGEAALESLEGQGSSNKALQMLERQGLWFRKSDETDSEIRSRFLGLIEEGMQGQLGKWEGSPQGALALIILLDQFTRNVFRGEAASFQADALAVEVAKRAVDKAFDLVLPTPMRLFVYMPFMHCEDLEVSSEGVRLFEKAAVQVPGDVPDLKKIASDFAVFAEQHRDVIAHFGRFPHRNSVLGRQSTADEMKYLEAGGGFG